MTPETIVEIRSIVEELAPKIGHGAETLLSWYAARAPYEMAFPFLAAIVFVVGAAWLINSINKCQKAEEANSKHYSMCGEGVMYLVQSMLAGGATLISGIVFLNTFRTGVMAFASPEAYALEHLMKAILGVGG